MNFLKYVRKIFLKYVRLIILVWLLAMFHYIYRILKYNFLRQDSNCQYVSDNNEQVIFFGKTTIFSNEYVCNLVFIKIYQVFLLITVFDKICTGIPRSYR